MASDIKPELLQDMPDLDKHEVIGTNGTNNTHTITESITSANNTEQSDESNLETTPPPAATEQIEAVVVREDEDKPQKPANGELN